MDYRRLGANSHARPNRKAGTIPKKNTNTIGGALLRVPDDNPIIRMTPQNISHRTATR